MNANGEACSGVVKIVPALEEATYTYADFGGTGQCLRLTQDSLAEMKVRVILED